MSRSAADQGSPVIASVIAGALCMPAAGARPVAGGDGLLAGNPAFFFVQLKAVAITAVYTLID